MKRRFTPTAPVVAAIAAGMIVGMLVLSYLLSSGFSGKGEPPPLSAPTAEDEFAGGAENLRKVERITVTPQNVQKVIGALERTASYTQTVTSTLYYDEESSVQTVVQYVRPDACRTDVLRGGAVIESSLRLGEEYYAWRAGSTFHGAAGGFTADGMAMIPDWRTVAELPADSILSAASEVIDGEPTLFVTAEAEGRIEEYEISTISGLLRAARYYEGDELIRTIEVTEVEMEAPADTHFAPP